MSFTKDAPIVNYEPADGDVTVVVGLLDSHGVELTVSGYSRQRVVLRRHSRPEHPDGDLITNPGRFRFEFFEQTTDVARLAFFDDAGLVWSLPTRDARKTFYDGDCYDTDPGRLEIRGGIRDEETVQRMLAILPTVPPAVPPVEAKA